MRVHKPSTKYFKTHIKRVLKAHTNYRRNKSYVLDLKTSISDGYKRILKIRILQTGQVQI